MTAAAHTPLLHTLAPQLRHLEERLADWLARPRRAGLLRGRTEGMARLATDLSRVAADLETDQPLLIILLMGGTGVGKSSLLNALARGAVAHASFTRPTTRDSVVYYHAAVDPNRFDARLRLCKLVSHDRPALALKILIDTPDLDSNEPSHREKLRQVLPLADVVLYVGSQEKYHDQAGWELFLEQRRRRAFAFVLNKWDRCLHGLNSGLRPDEDLVQDLRDEGFSAPLIFRTCAQAWINAQDTPADLPPGEQFAELEAWLEQGLTTLEIQAIKTRGVGQLLNQMTSELRSLRPADLAEAVAKTSGQWSATLSEEADAVADLVLTTLEPYHRNLERHFAAHAQRLFRGVTAGFLRFFNWLRYLGTSWRRRLPGAGLLPGGSAHVDPSLAGGLSDFAEACSQVAADRHLDARQRALPNRLLVQADAAGMPVAPLNAMLQEQPLPSWRQLLPGFLRASFDDLETAWKNPARGRHLLQRVLAWTGDLLPIVVFIAACGWLMYAYFFSEKTRTFAWSDLFLPPAAVFFTLLIFFFILNLLLPARWPVIRGAFRRHLRDQLAGVLHEHFGKKPQQLASAVVAERDQIDQVLAELKQVRQWVEQQEQSAQVSALYGSGAGESGPEA
ncbi:MAG TPA: 50S ribosome-binding GTPase [Gemmatales bacterium]|nr:50S ribosome-binding GTPase [Gemmatales bacterium]HMP58072.1 50S ribosome-binding GTPase [Gemmatales bacterium]